MSFLALFFNLFLFLVNSSDPTMPQSSEPTMSHLKVEKYGLPSLTSSRKQPLIFLNSFSSTLGTCRLAKISYIYQ